MLICICMAMTAPINSDMIITKGIESTPSLDISNTVRLPKVRHRSGMANTLLMNRQYRPKVASECDISIYASIKTGANLAKFADSLPL